MTATPANAANVIRFMLLSLDSLNSLNPTRHWPSLAPPAVERPGQCHISSCCETAFARHVIEVGVAGRNASHDGLGSPIAGSVRPTSAARLGMNDTCNGETTTVLEMPGVRGSVRRARQGATLTSKPIFPPPHFLRQICDLRRDGFYGLATTHRGNRGATR